MDKIIGKFILELGKVGLLVCVSTLSWGFITMKLWNWFLLFVFSVPEISFREGVALSVFLILFNKVARPSLKEEYYAENKTTRTIMSLLVPWVLLLSAWIIHLAL